MVDKKYIRVNLRTVNSMAKETTKIKLRDSPIKALSWKTNSMAKANSSCRIWATTMEALNSVKSMAKAQKN